MGFVEWVAKPRLNYLDCAVAGAVAGLVVNGAYIAAAIVFAVGVVASAFIEVKAGF